MPRFAAPGRGTLWALLGCSVALLVAWVAAVALMLLRADHRLNAGISAAGRARAGLSLTDLTDGGAERTLHAAAADFAAAHRAVASPWVAPMRVLPYLGTQVRSVDALSQAAATVAGAGESTLATVRLLVAEPHHTPAERADLLGRMAGVLGRLRNEVSDVGLGPAHGLLGKLAHERAVFDHDLAKVRGVLDRVAGATGALHAMFSGKQTYLLLVANNAEMRAGSGMALEAGTIRLDRGAISLTHLQDTGNLVGQFPGVEPTGDLAARWGFEYPQVDLRELLMSPQFPANAALAARMWQAHTGQPVDGVLLVDVQALDDLLPVIGPVSADGVTLSAGNAVHYLLEGQYAGVADAQVEAARHERLGAIADAVFGRLEAPGIPLTALARALGRAVDGRHVLAWASDPRVEADWVAAGAGGQVEGNELLLALINQAADKLDPYQRVTAVASTHPSGTRTRVSIRVTIDNTTPETLTGYAAGGAPGTPPAREYAGYASLDFPLDATDATVTGAGPIVAAGPDLFAQVLAVEIAVPDGQSRSVTFAFSLPGRNGSLTVEPSARIPPTSWVAGDATTVRFEDSVAHSFSW